MEHYIQYPFPRDVVVPVNYCVLEKLLGGGKFLSFVFRDVFRCGK